MKYHGSISDAKDLITREFADHYGVCSTKNSTQAKTVTIPGLAALYEGCHITVKFTAAQTYNGVPTLNVNGLGAVNIRRDGGTNAARYEWVAGEVLHLVYDGTYWIIVDGGLATTTYYGVTKLYTGAASTSEALALTPKTLNSLAINSIWGYPVYSSSSTYAVGDRVRYSVGVYECITAIETAESWTAEHWQLIPTLQTQINGKSTVVANPTLAGTETTLTAIEINGTKYKIEGGAALTLDSIYVSTPPTKTAYVYGETFNATGMVVKGRYAISGVVIAEQVVTGYTYPTTLTVGQTSVTITYAENGVTKTTTQAITVAKATPTVTAPTARTLTYSGSAQNLVNAGSTTGGTLQYSLNNSTWGTSIPQGTNAGSYTVYYRVVGGTNYNDVAAQSVSCSIGKATGTLSVSPNSLTVDEGDAGTATITTNFDGTITASTSDSSTATASISGTTVTVSGVADGSATITLTASGGTNYTVPSSVTISVTVEAASASGIYGAVWDGTSTTAWTRTDDAANFTDPVPYVSGATSYGSPFDTISPWKDMTIVEDSEAGTMVKIPKFWFKMENVNGGLKIQISPTQQTGFSVSPAHMDRGDGKGERDVVYIGRYHCGSTAYKSVTGQTPKVSVTRSAARTAIAALGANVWQSDFAMRMTVQMLYLVEFADWESQGKIGFGCAPNGSTSAVRAMGYTDSMPYHTGTDQTSRTTYGGTQYRHIEGLWDNCYDWMDGCYYNSFGMNVIKNPANFSDSANGTSIGTPTSGYPKAITVSSVNGFKWCYYPTTSGGSNTTYVPDYWDFGSGNPCLYVGGNYGQNRNRGLFCVNYFSATNSDASIGCRLQKLP